MTIEREVTIEGQTYTVTLSDENEALQAAKAAGRAIVGLWRENREKEAAGLMTERMLDAETTQQKEGSEQPDLRQQKNAVYQHEEMKKDGENGQKTVKQQTDYSACLYLITDPEDADDTFLERVVRRHLHLPWIIAKTDRLIIREFSPDDPLEVPSAEDADGTFSDWNKREKYRKHQYRFAECGLWALERRADGVLIGKAGLTDGELGYHIYESFRRQGYALEACRAILKYGFEVLELEEIRLRTKRSNIASQALAEKLGFVLLSPISLSQHHMDIYAQKDPDGEPPFSSAQVPSPCEDSIVFCMQRGYNSLYTK